MRPWRGVSGSSPQACGGRSARGRSCASASTSAGVHAAARGALARATFGQYPDVLAGLREHDGFLKAARAVPRHLARALRHRA
jgi:hypothetical protein